MILSAAGRRIGLFIARPVVLLVAVAAVAGLVVGLAGPRSGLLVVGAVAACLATVYLPGAIFAAYFLIAFYKAAVQPFSPIDVTVVLAVLNAVQLIPMLGSARPRAVSAAGLILWIGLALLVLAGAIYAPDPSLARTTVVNWWALVFVPLLAGALRVASDPRYIRQFLWVIFGTSVFNVALGLTMLSSTERLVLLGNNTIGVSRAAVLVPLLAATFVLAQVGKIWRVAVVAAIPAAFVVALASGSRGPVLVLGAMGIAAGIRAFARPQTRDWRIPAAAGAAVVAVVLVTSSISSYLPGLSVQRFELFEELLQSGVSGEVNTSVGDTSSGIRLQMFGLAADLFVERPVLGVGTAGFAAVSPLYLSTREGEAYPHNTVLQFAAEFGLVGLVIYLALIVLALVRRLPSGPEYTSLRALFIFFFLNAMVSGDIYTDRQTWALLLLILLADLRVPSRVNAIVPGHDRRLLPAFARARS